MSRSTAVQNPPRSSSGMAGEPRSSPAGASRAVRSCAEQVERDAVVELLRTEVAAARRESLHASTELVEVREECRAGTARCEQEKIRLNVRLRSQKARLDEVLQSEIQAHEERAEAEAELQKLQLKIKGQDRVHQEERVRERNGAQTQLGKLKQRFKDTEEEKAGLKAACARQQGEVEAIDELATERAAALEQQERELSRLALARDGVQAALEASNSEARVLALRLASVEESRQRSFEDQERSHEEMSQVVSQLRASAQKAEARADEEARCSAELRFELLHALHHELPTERNRVIELESRERARAERLRGVCEAEVSDLPSDLMEKVQNAIRRHETWWRQNAVAVAGCRQNASPSQRGRRPSRQQQINCNSARSPSPNLAGVNAASDLLKDVKDATSRYEAVLGALAQCAGASARENMELRARLAPGAHEQETPPEISRKLAGLKREVAKVREDNQELRIQRQQQEDTIQRMRQDFQAREEASLLQLKASKKVPAPSVVGFHTQHRRQVRVFEAEVRQAESRMEKMKEELSEQQCSNTQEMEMLRDQVRELQHREVELSMASSKPVVERLAEHQLQRRIGQLEIQLEESQACNAAVTSSSNSAALARKVARRSFVRKRLQVVSQRLGQISGESGFSDLLKLSDPLCVAAVDCSRLTFALAEERRSRDHEMVEMQRRLKDLETALTQKEGLSRSWEEEAASRLEERNAAVQELEVLIAKGARISSPSTEQSTPTKLTSDESNSGGLPTKPPSSTGSGRVSYRDVDRGHDKAGLPSFEQLVLKTGMNLPASAASTSAPSTPQPAIQTRPHPEEACISGTDRKPAASAESMLIQRWVRAAIDMQGNADASHEEDLELSVSQDHDQEPPLKVSSEIDGVHEDVVSLGDPPEVLINAPLQEGSPSLAAREAMRLKMAVRRNLIESSGFATSVPEADCVESQAEMNTGFFSKVKHLLHLDQKDGTENHASGERQSNTWKKSEATQEEEQVDLMENDSQSLEFKQKEDVDFLEKDVGALENECAAVHHASMGTLDPGTSKGQRHAQPDTTSSDSPQEGKEFSGDQESPPLTPRSPTHGWLTRLGIDFSGSPAPDESTCIDDTVEGEVGGSPIDARSARSSNPAGDDAAESDVEDLTMGEPAIANNAYSHSQIVETQVFPDFVGGGCTSSSSLGLISRRRLPPVAEERDPRVVEETELEEVFSQASMLCDSQRYEEALPLFHELLMLLQEADSASMRSLEAEARAHLGVALQSLGRVEDAIAAYCSAVEQDPSLHVCHANLAQLHGYLEDRKAARAHIDLALQLDPSNDLYKQLHEQFWAAEAVPKS